MNAVTGRVGRHYAWPLSGPSPATIGALVQVAGMLSDTNREPRPSCGNRRSGVLIVRPGRLDRVISRPLAGVSTRPRHHAGYRSPSRRSGARRSLSAHEHYGIVGRGEVGDRRGCRSPCRPGCRIPGFPSGGSVRHHGSSALRLLPPPSRTVRKVLPYTALPQVVDRPHSTLPGCWQPVPAICEAPRPKWPWPLRDRTPG